MRTVLILLLFAAAVEAGDLFGSWKAIPARSIAPYPGTLIVRIEPHPRGEVFTLDSVDGGGRATTASTVLYFDGQPRELQDAGCSGTQSSRRLDKSTVEVLRTCAGGEWTRFILRRRAKANELVLEITEHRSNRHLERRLALEKQSQTPTSRNR